MAAATSIAMGLIAAASAGYGAHQSHQATKSAKSAARDEQARLAEASKEALKERKSLIDKQRKQLVGGEGGYRTGLTGGGMSQDDMGGLLG